MNIHKQYSLTFGNGMFVGSLLTLVVLALMTLLVRADPYFIVSLGQSRANLSHGTSDGSVAWQQKGFPHEEHLDTTTFSLGMGYNFKPWLSLEGRYVNAGTISQKGEWKYYDDLTINPDCPCTGWGSSPIQGYTLATVFRYHLKDWSLGIEGGGFKWYAPWTEHISTSKGPFDYGPVKSQGLGGMGGLIIGYKNFDLRYEVLHVQPRDGIYNDLKVVSALWKF